jgi:hypothetical protein
LSEGESLLLMRVPWNEVLTVDKALVFLRSSVAPMAQRHRMFEATWSRLEESLGTKPEVALAVAMLVCESKTDHCMFLTTFGWILRSVEESGDLGIPLCAIAAILEDRDLRDFKTDETSLDEPHGAFRTRCENYMAARWCDTSFIPVVVDAVELIKRLRRTLMFFHEISEGMVNSEGSWVSNFPATVQGGLSFVKRALHLVAWLRSRWICFTHHHQNPNSTSHTKSRRKHAEKEVVLSYAVVPVVEMLNHDPRSQLCPTVEYGEYVELSLQWEFLHRVSPGEPNSCEREICIDYGPLSNTALLVRYGFVLEVKDNPSEYFDVPLLGTHDDRCANDDVSESTRYWCVDPAALTMVWRVRQPLCSRLLDALPITPPIDVLFTALMVLLPRFVADAPSSAALTRKQLLRSVVNSDSDDDISDSSILFDDEAKNVLWGSVPVQYRVQAIALLAEKVNVHVQEPALAALHRLGGDRDLSSLPNIELSNLDFWCLTLALQRKKLAKALIECLTEANGCVGKW